MTEFELRDKLLSLGCKVISIYMRSSRYVAALARGSELIVATGGTVREALQSALNHFTPDPFSQFNGATIVSGKLLAGNVHEGSDCTCTTITDRPQIELVTSMGTVVIQAPILTIHRV